VGRSIEPLPPEEQAKITEEVAEQLPPETRDDLLSRLQALPRKEQEQIVGMLLPTQRTTDRIWEWIVGAFALGFLICTLALCYVIVIRSPDELQTLLTVVTTLAGLLAGFISGRASAGNNPS